jgi:hypothetical protein
MPASNLDEARAMARSAAGVIETVANELADAAERQLDTGEREAARHTRSRSDELVREIERLRAI